MYLENEETFQTENIFPDNTNTAFWLGTEEIVDGMKKISNI